MSLYSCTVEPEHGAGRAIIRCRDDVHTGPFGFFQIATDVAGCRAQVPGLQIDNRGLGCFQIGKFKDGGVRERSGRNANAHRRVQFMLMSPGVQQRTEIRVPADGRAYGETQVADAEWTSCEYRKRGAAAASGVPCVD